MDQKLEIKQPSNPEDKMEARLELNPSPWLSGWARVVLQLGSAGVVCLLLILAQMSQQSLLREIREDQRDEVHQFRDELKDQRNSDRDTSSKQWQILRENTGVIKDHTDAVRTMVTEMKDMHRESHRAVPTKAPPRIEAPK